MKFFKPNEGSLDRGLRIIFGVALLALSFFILSGLLQTLAMVFGLISLFTGITGFCGLYKLFGINTCPKK